MLIESGLVAKTLSVLFMAIISPGPDFFMVLRNSLTYGRKAGIISAMGIASGCLISFTLVLCGLEILFSYKLFKLILSLVCGCYLIYLGFISMRNQVHHQRINATQQKTAPLLVYYRNGLVTNLLNPKLYTLSAAILAYTEQQHPTFASNVTIILGQAILALLWFISVSFLFSHARVQDAYLKRERLMNIILGFILIIIGSRVMFG